MPNYKHKKMITKWLQVRSITKFLIKESKQNMDDILKTQAMLKKNYDMDSVIKKHPTKPTFAALFYSDQR